MPATSSRLRMSVPRRTKSSNVKMACGGWPASSSASRPTGSRPRAARGPGRSACISITDALRARVTVLDLRRSHEAEDSEFPPFEFRVEDAPVTDDGTAGGVGHILKHAIGGNNHPGVLDRDFVAVLRHTRCRQMAIGNRAA